MNDRTATAPFIDIDTDTNVLSSIGMIEEAVTLAGSGSAVVLGCGRCTEIPIRLLNDKFDVVDLVDIDTSALAIVKEQCKQWNDESNSYQFHSADLTGMIAKVERRASEVTSNAVKPIECLEQLGALLESVLPEFWVPPHEQRHDLIICSTVLTQLQASVRESVERIYLKRFPEHTAVLSQHKPWCKSLWNFARKLEDAFINHLRTLTKPGGIVYLSATVHVAWLTQTDERSVITEGRWIATKSSRLVDYLSLQDQIITERNWNWLRQEKEGEYWGRLYGVQAVIYRITSDLYNRIKEW